MTEEQFERLMFVLNQISVYLGQIAVPGVSSTAAQPYGHTYPNWYTCPNCGVSMRLGSAHICYRAGA